MSIQVLPGTSILVNTDFWYPAYFSYKGSTKESISQPFSNGAVLVRSILAEKPFGHVWIFVN